MNNTDLPDDKVRKNLINFLWTRNKMNAQNRTTFCSIVILTVFGGTVINWLTDGYSRNIHRDNLIPRQRDNGKLHTYSLPGINKCKIDVLHNLNNSPLKKVQNERKSRIRDVCNMCQRNRTSMECNHVTMDEDYHKKIIYENLIVDDKHKVCINLI